MAYNSAYTGPEIDTAISKAGKIDSSTDVTGFPDGNLLYNNNGKVGSMAASGGGTADPATVYFAVAHPNITDYEISLASYFSNDVLDNIVSIIVSGYMEAQGIANFTLTLTPNSFSSAFFDIDSFINVVLTYSTFTKSLTWENVSWSMFVEGITILYKK